MKDLPLTDRAVKGKDVKKTRAIIFPLSTNHIIDL